MKNEIVKLDIPELQGIEPSKAAAIRATFEPMAEMLNQFEEAYNDVVIQARKEITSEVTAKAKRLRLDIAKVRIETEKVRKEEKEEYLRAGKAIDGVSNILKWAVSDKENKLKEIEDHFEIQEQKRLEVLQAERVDQLSKYVEDAHERLLSGMDNDVWDAYLSTRKREYEDRIAAEKKAEADRIAKEKEEAAERERIRLENKKLKAEAEKAAVQAEAERKEREAQEAVRIAKEKKEQAARDEAARKERAEYEAKLKAERDERERIEREEKIKREKLEAELKARADAERKAKEDEAARIQAELNKGDAAKVSDLINDLAALKEKYIFKSQQNKTMYISVGMLIDKIINHIKNS